MDAFLFRESTRYGSIGFVTADPGKQGEQNQHHENKDNLDREGKQEVDDVQFGEWSICRGGIQISNGTDDNTGDEHYPYKAQNGPEADRQNRTLQSWSST